MIGICRLCAALRKSELLITIVDVNHDICQKLRQCCQVDIQMDDSLPKCVCWECVQALQQAFDFYKKVHDSQESLSAIFASVDNDTGQGFLKDITTDIDVEENFSLGVDESALIKMDIEISENEMQSESNALTSYRNDADSHVNEVSIVFDSNGDDDAVDEVFLIEKILKKKLRRSTGEGSSCEEEWTMEKYRSDEGNAEDQTEDDVHGDLRRRDLVLGEKIDDEPNCTTAVEIATKSMDDKRHIKEQQEIVEPKATWLSYPWRCSLCPVTESTLQDLIAHNQVAHDQQPMDVQYKCADCHKLCLRYYNLLNHVRSRHRSELSLCCDVCNEYCANFKQLGYHRHTEHVTEPDFPDLLLCPDCGRAFQNQNSLQIHMKMHGEKMKLYVCGKCGYQFKRMYSLKAHQKVHSGVKEFSCEVCGKGFHQKVNLMTHMYSHIDEKPFECETCKKTFKTSLGLLKHKETHTDVKHFKCDHCDRSFRTKDAKLSHERTHTGEMPYKCQYCQRLFRFRSTLLSHLNTHTGNRPYSCIPCDHHFTNWSNYNKHMKRRHPTGDSNVVAPVKSRKRSTTIGKRSSATKSLQPVQSTSELGDVTNSSTIAMNSEEVCYTLADGSPNSDSYQIFEISHVSEEDQEDADGAGIDLYIDSISKV